MWIWANGRGINLTNATSIEIDMEKNDIWIFHGSESDVVDAFNHNRLLDIMGWIRQEKDIKVPPTLQEYIYAEKAFLSALYSTLRESPFGPSPCDKDEKFRRYFGLLESSPMEYFLTKKEISYANPMGANEFQFSEVNSNRKKYEEYLEYDVASIPYSIRDEECDSYENVPPKYRNNINYSHNIIFNYFSYIRGITSTKKMI